MGRRGGGELWGIWCSCWPNKICVLVILYTTIVPSWLYNLDQTLIEEKREELKLKEEDMTYPRWWSLTSRGRTRTQHPCLRASVFSVTHRRNGCSEDFSFFFFFNIGRPHSPYLPLYLEISGSLFSSGS